MNSEKQSTNLQMTLREVNRVGEGQKNVPKLRFKGYEDAWEQRKFMECINNVVDYRGKTPKKLGMNWSEEGFLALSALNVKDGYIDFELDANYGDIELYNAWMKQDLSKGQVVFTTEAPMGNVAQIPDESKYILSQRVIAFEVAHEKITDDFLATLLKSPKVFDNLTSLATGGTAKGVSQRSLSKLSVKIPQIIEEQNKIAKIICTLNKAITLHQRKYDALKSMKKTLLSKMFPKNGEDVPEIRFKEFTDAWEQRKLGEVGTTYTGLSGKTKEDFGHGNGQFVTYMNVFSNAVASSEMVEPVEIDERQNKVVAGDVLFTTSSETPEEVGMSSVWLENSKNTYLNSFCFGYRPRIPFDPYYLAFMLRSSLMRKKITFLAQGISRYNISKNKMMDIEIPVPIMSEQHQIGEYFRNLEHLITLHQRKIEELKNMKKTLLQQMFV